MKFPELICALVLLSTGWLVPDPARAQTGETAFTLQGELQQDDGPAHGAFDFEARLYLPGDPVPLGVETFEDVPVVAGQFVLLLDFTDAAFLEFGNAVSIELAVRAGASSEPHTVLGERLSIEPTPLAQLARRVMPGSVGLVEIDPAQVQRRVTALCPPNQAIRSIAEDGSVDCDPDESGISLSVGEGLTGGGSSGAVSVGVDFDAVQRRVASACPQGQSIRSIGADGAVVCEPDDSELSVAIQTGSTDFFGGAGTTAQPQATALCPTSWRAIGGGFDSNCQAAQVHRSQPTTNGVGWFVQAVKSTTANCPTPSTLVAYAICVP